MTRKRKPKQIRPLIDICIVVHGRFDLLTQCLDAVPDACGDIKYNLIIVDNASPDEKEAREFYRAKAIEHPKGTVIRNYKNLGFPKANNQAAREGKAPLIFLLNSDVILEPGSVELLVKDMDDPKIGIVGMHLVFPEYAGGLNQQIRPAGKTQHVGMETSINGRFNHIFVGWEPTHPKVIAMRETYAVTGAALMTRRSIWKKTNGFDEVYGQGTYEDVDFCLQTREMGYNIIVNPVSMGVHYTGATAEQYRIGFPLENNRMIFLQKWQQNLTWTEWNRL